MERTAWSLRVSGLGVQGYRDFGPQGYGFRSSLEFAVEGLRDEGFGMHGKYIDAYKCMLGFLDKDAHNGYQQCRPSFI